MLYDLHILCSREKIFFVWWLSIRKLRVKNTLVTPQILSSMVRYKCIDFLLFIGMMMMMMMMKMMMMIMMMKCGQKSSLNFFIFAPLNKVNVNFYQLVPRLSESISTSKKRRISFFTRHRSFLYASKREKIRKVNFSSN